jgi:hypothetical protein
MRQIRSGVVVGRKVRLRDTFCDVRKMRFLCAKIVMKYRDIGMEICKMVMKVKLQIRRLRNDGVELR